MSRRKDKGSDSKRAAAGLQNAVAASGSQPTLVQQRQQQQQQKTAFATPNVLLPNFDPLSLLETVEFPDDREEVDIRHQHDKRKKTIRYFLFITKRLQQLQKRAQLQLVQVEGSASDATKSNEGASSSEEGSENKSTEAINGGDGGVGGDRGAEPNKQSSESLAQMPQTEASESMADDSPSATDDIATVTKMEKSTRNLARYAAAIQIQRVWRGYITCVRYIAIAHKELSIRNLGDRSAYFASLPSLGDFSAPAQLQQTIYQRLFRKQLQVPDFCAIVIQSWLRMYRQRRQYEKIVEERMEAIRTIIQYWRQHKTRRLIRNAHTMATKIQKTWRRFFNRKIFGYYKSLITFREKGDPKRILRFINPTESQIIDAAAAIHVRFRFGGETFPPNIYYKIFTHAPTIDICAFSPRDYTAVKQPAPVFLHNDLSRLKGSQLRMKGRQKNLKGQNWYLRWENNGWRPVTERLLATYQDPVAESTAQKRAPFNHMRLARKQDLERMRKEKKRKWLATLYQLAKSEKGDVNMSQQDDVGGADDVEFETLIKWSDGLDFDSYNSNWTTIATTERSDEKSSFISEVRLQQLSNHRQLNPSTVSNMNVDSLGKISDVETELALIRSLKRWSKQNNEGTDTQMPKAPSNALETIRSQESNERPLSTRGSSASKLKVDSPQPDHDGVDRMEEAYQQMFLPSSEVPTGY